MWPLIAKLTLTTWLTASTADAVTTIQARSAGAVELNPMLAGPVWTVPAAKVGAGAAAVLYWQHDRRDHPKRAAVIGLIATAAYLGLAVHNHHITTQQQGRR